MVMALRKEQEIGESGENLPIPQLGIALLQNALHELDLPYSHINDSNINIVESYTLIPLRRSYATAVSVPAAITYVDRIYVSRRNPEQRFTPAIILHILAHEEGHYVEMEFQKPQTIQIGDVTFEKHGLLIQADKTEFFRPFDEASAEHFADFAIRKSQNILTSYPELYTARVTPNSGHITKDYQDYFAFWDWLKDQYAQSAHIEPEIAEKKLLRSMANGDMTALFEIANLFGQDALMLLGLYGITLKTKFFFTGTQSEHSDRIKLRNNDIKDYFLTDEQLLTSEKYASYPRDTKIIRNAIASHVRQSVKEFSPSTLKLAEKIPQVIFASHTH